MKSRTFFLGSLILGLVVLLGSSPFLLSSHKVATNKETLANPMAGSKSITEGQRAKVVENFGKLPLYFIENKGQVDKRVKYYAQANGQSLFFTKEGVVFSLRKGQEKTKDPACIGGGPDTLSESRKPQPVYAPRSVMRLTPVSMRKGVKITALGPQEHKVNYFFGNNPKKWRTKVPTYKAVVYKEAYPGIDLKFYGNGLQMEYDIIVKSGADPSQVKFHYTGVKSLEVTQEGNLLVKLSDGGELIQKKPIVYQEIGGNRVAREGKFKAYQDTANLTYGFELAAYDKKYPLIIDPVLVYSTYLGGSSEEYGFAIERDQNGSVYISGFTTSSDFPLKNPMQSSLSYSHGFVTKVMPDGITLDYSTYFGGGGPNSIAIDSAGNVYLTGHANSYDLPVKNAFQAQPAGNTEAFVTKLDITGALVYSTYLGGSYIDGGQGIKVDGMGQACVTGFTGSSNFPTKNPIQGQAGSWDIFVTKFSADGSTLIYSTFIGGSGDDRGEYIALDSYGHAYVTGFTNSPNFPTLNPIQPYNGGGLDAFALKLAPDGQSFGYSTYLGGNGDDKGQGIVVDQSGQVFVSGYTRSTNFPTRNPFQPANAGGLDVFLTKLKADGSDLVFSTYLGGSGDDYEGYFWFSNCTLAVDQYGQAFIVGSTLSPDFPIINALQNSNAGGRDGFVAKIKADGSALVFSTYLGGSGDDAIEAITVDNAGHIYVTGWTLSNNFPTQNAFQQDYKGGRDAFLVKIFDVLPNQPPTANAGNNVNIAGEALSTTIIIGTATDTDSTGLTYRWKKAETALSGWTSVGEGGAAPLNLGSVDANLLGIGPHTLTLEVSDGQNTATDEMILTVENSSPHAVPNGGAFELGAEVTLGGTVSDYDGDSLTYKWIKDGNVLHSGGGVQTNAGGDPVQLPTHSLTGLGLGEHKLNLVVIDTSNNQDSQEVTINIVDTTAPALAPVPSTGILWPPDHRLVEIVIEANSSDLSGTRILSVGEIASNEPQDGLGDGDTAPDWNAPEIDQVNGFINLELRAERSAKGEGRVYTIPITATDGAGNSTTVAVTIKVPHDQRKTSSQ